MSAEGVGMKWVIAALLGVTLLAQGPDFPGTPDNPWPEHQEPSPGWFCEHDSPIPAHNCTCQRMAYRGDGEGESCGEPHESPQCKVWCHQDHCHCEYICSDQPDPNPPQEPQ